MESVTDIGSDVVALVRDAVHHYWEPNVVFGHGWDHAERIVRHAYWLAEREKCSASLACCSCYLIDAGLNIQRGRASHIERGIVIAREVIRRVLALGPHEEAIIEAISCHEGETDCSSCRFRESLVVHDADTLDRLGATGIAMTMQYGRWINRPFAANEDPLCVERNPELDGYTLDYIVYLGSLHKCLCTAGAARAALPKLREWQQFVSGLTAQVQEVRDLNYEVATRLLSTVCKTKAET